MEFNKEDLPMIEEIAGAIKHLHMLDQAGKLERFIDEIERGNHKKLSQYEDGQEDIKNNLLDIIAFYKKIKESGALEKLFKE